MESNRIQEDVKCDSTSTQKGLPPPLVILTVEYKVSNHNGELKTCNAKKCEHKEGKSKQIVHLMKPNCGHDKVNFNENTTKLKQT